MNSPSTNIRPSPPINRQDFRRRMIGCWLGKAVGGTLGMPYEGVDQMLELTFYDPVPTQMLPNDDLDLQVVYAFLLDKLDDIRVNRHDLVAAWPHVGMSPDEYGICKRNLKLGLKPPHTGSFDNPFTDGMGAAIRTELWACLAPGNPDLAAQYAYEDACMDHAGDGIYAALFLAALQSLAFVESDIDRLLDAALTQIPVHCRVRRAVTDVRVLHSQGKTPDDIQRHILEHFNNDNFTDVAPNLAFIVLGWIASEGDFSKGICLAVNCGLDTDCTGATLGALMGILNPDGIDERWLQPIGQDIVLSPSIVNVDHPPTIDTFTDLVLDLHDRLNGKPPAQDNSPEPDLTALEIQAEVGFQFSGIALPIQLPEKPAQTHVVHFKGQHATWPADAWEDSAMWIRYHVDLKESETIHLLFNTPEPCRVWFDDQFVFGRDGGPFIPAMHRPPLNQFAKIDAAQGKHTITAIIRQPSEPRDIQWVVGLCDDPTEDSLLRDWLTGVFTQPTS